jgi:hypothetical protein
MNDVFGWLIKLLFLALLAPFFMGCALSLAGAALTVLMPWLIGLTIALAILIGVTAGVAAGLVQRRLRPLPPGRFPPGDVPQYRRPRGSRNDR